MQHASMTPETPAQPLLFRQIALLAAISGVLAFRHPAAGAVSVLLLLALTLPAERLRALPLLVAAFTAGIGLAWTADISPPRKGAIPAWVLAATTPAGENTDPAFTSGVAVSGIIREATRLPDARIRLLLADVRTASPDERPLPGLLALSWRNPPPELASAGPGQTLAATLRLREVRGFSNPGVWETEQWWRDRNVFYRAWNRDEGSRNSKTPSFRLTGEASAAWQFREALRARVVMALAGSGSEKGPHPVSPAASIVLALLFGDRSLCPQPMLDLVANATLAHSLSLSGTHLGFVAAACYTLAHFLGYLLPGLFLRVPRQKVGLFLALPACLGYLWLGGAPPSLVRSALMLLFWGWLLWRNQPKVLVDGLIWAVAVIVAFSPTALYDIGLQLSAVSVAGIALAAPFLQRLSRAASALKHPERSRGARSLLNPLPGKPGLFASPSLRRALMLLAAASGVSIAAQAAILPLLLDAFPGLGLWFPLNLIWLPALGLWVMPLSFFGLFLSFLSLLASGMAAGICSSAASALFALAALPCAGLVSLLEGMNSLGILFAPMALRPCWPAWCGFWLLLLLLPGVYKARTFTRRTALLACAGMALLVGPSLYASLTAVDHVRMTLLDVGQGQAVLVSWRENGENGRVLIDGGGFAASNFDIGRQVVAPAITANTPPALHAVINSHPDADHLQGLLFPLNSFRVGAFFIGPEDGLRVTQTMNRRDAILRRRNMLAQKTLAGDTITLSRHLVLEVVSPPERFAAKNSANERALALRLVHKGNPLALICGDMEKQSIARMLASGYGIRAETLVLPHHGSAGSFNPALYTQVNPRLALVSCGYANIWHFPAVRIRKELARLDIPLLSTADLGQIRVEWRNNAPARAFYARGNATFSLPQTLP